jgi:hypothetical protein
LPVIGQVPGKSRCRFLTSSYNPPTCAPF